MNAEELTEMAERITRILPSNTITGLVLNAAYRNINSGANTIQGYSGYGKKPAMSVTNAADAQKLLNGLAEKIANGESLINNGDLKAALAALQALSNDVQSSVSGIINWLSHL